MNTIVRLQIKTIKKYILRFRVFFYSLLTADMETGQNSISLYRVVMLNTVLLIAIGLFSFGIFYRLVKQDNNFFLFINLITLIILCTAFLWIRKTRMSRTPALVASAVLITSVIGFIFVNGNIDCGIFWTYLVPVFIIFINGYALGLLMLGFFYFAICIVMLAHWDIWSATGWNTLCLLRFCLSSGILVLILSACIKIFDIFQKELYETSITDSLTKLYNRGYISSCLEREIEKKTRMDTPLSFVLLDVDNFKRVNDTLGHSVGDSVLRELAGILSKNARTVDFVGRWGGEEFCIIMPHTPQKNALIVAQRIRAIIQQHEFSKGLSITCSFGLCSIGHNNFTQEQLVMMADNALYEAKNSGKDRICHCLLKNRCDDGMDTWESGNEHH